MIVKAGERPPKCSGLMVNHEVVSWSTMELSHRQPWSGLMVNHGVPHMVNQGVATPWLTMELSHGQPWSGLIVNHGVVSSSAMKWSHGRFDHVVKAGERPPNLGGTSPASTTWSKREMAAGRCRNSPAFVISSVYERVGIPLPL